MSPPFCLPQVRLLGIDASSIADGIPSVVLNLVWNIILYFQARFPSPPSIIRHSDVLIYHFTSWPVVCLCH